MLETDVDINALNELGPEELLRHAADTFGARAAIGTSLQKTGTVMIDMAHKLGIPLRVFFIDTLLNHPETYELLEEFQDRYFLCVYYWDYSVAVEVYDDSDLAWDDEGL